MNYSNYRSGGKRKRISAFYIVFAFCLLAVGVATWYSAHRVRAKMDQTDYESNTPQRESSYVPSVPQETEIAGNTVSDQPYTSSAPLKSEPEEKKESVAYVFPVNGEIAKSFSDTRLQYSETYGDMRLHRGMDILCKEGTAVSVAASGKVTAVEESAEFGTVITVDHENGMTTRYACIRDPKVAPGDKVAAGDILGTTGEIPGECAEKSHLHFEVLTNGTPTDPALLFKTE